MNHTVTMEDAKAIATLLPSLMRQLGAGHDDPAAELPLAQLRVCSVLAGGPRPMSALGRELRVSLSAMTQLADRLERARLVKRVAQGDDRRVRCLQLTERGEKIMRSHRESRIERASAVLEHLSPTARQEVLAALRTLLDACTALRGQDDNQQEASADARAEKVAL
jgi:DNA-binding MarR family transcriptional regulator